MTTQDLFIILLMMIYPVRGTEYLIAVHHIKDGRHSLAVGVEVDETGGTLHYTCPYYNLHQSRNVPPNGTVEIQIYEALWTSTEVEYKGILVTSTNNEANVEVGSQFSSFAPLPTTALGTEYIVSSCYQYRYNSLLVIAAYNLTTSISITTRSRIFGPSFQRDNTRILELKPFQTFTFEHGTDLTGTVITSSHPVAVFSGMSNSTLVTAYDQLLPVKLHDKEYVVAVDDNPALYHIQIISEQNDTVVTFNNGSSLNVNSTLFKAQLTPLEILYFHSSNPVMACYSNIPNEFQLIIVSSISNTEINILLSKAITYKGLEYKPADTIRERLQSYQTLTINSSVALCGTSVSASHNVAVFTLSRFRNVITDYNQLLPVTQFGQEYIVAACDQGYVYDDYHRLLDFNSVYYVLVTSATNHTQVQFNDNLQVTVKAGISYRKNLKANESLHLSSTKPVMVSLCTDVTAILRTKQLDQSGCRIIIPRSFYKTKTTFAVERKKIIKIVTESTASDIIMIWSGGYDWNVSITWETHPQYKVGTAVVDAGQISISSMDRFTTVAFSIREQYLYSESSNILGNLWNPFGWNHEPETDGKNGKMTTVVPDVRVQDDHVNITLVATGTTLGVLILFLLAVIICQQIHIRRNTEHKGEKSDGRTEQFEASLQDQQRDTENVPYGSTAGAYSELNTESRVPDTYENINPSFSSDKNEKYENVESIF